MREEASSDDIGVTKGFLCGRTGHFQCSYDGKKDDWIMQGWLEHGGFILRAVHMRFNKMCLNRFATYRFRWRCASNDSIQERLWEI
jgi:hypothetical protein